MNIRQMDKRVIPIPEGFDTGSQFVVGQFVSQFDDQTRLIKKRTQDLDVSQLEWQPQPGINTIGMLLAHIAVAECWWISVVPRGISPEAEVEQRFVDTLGLKMEDDGLPLGPEDVHPQSLRGKSAAAYHALLDRARSASRQTLRDWQDDDLATEHPSLRAPVTRHWILYHVLEHTVAHFGQILLLQHMLQRATGNQGE